MNKETLNRKKNQQRASELDQLNGYLKVTGISAWFILATAVLVVASLFAWGAISHVEDRISGAAECNGGVLTCYFRQEDMNYVKAGAMVRVDDAMYEIQEIVPKLLYTYDVPREILFLSEQSEWYQTAIAACDLPDGTYSISVELGTYTPLGLMRERD